MGVRRFLAAGLDRVEGLVWEFKVGQKVVHEFYTHFYTFGQWSLERCMVIGFLVK
jgi:hypothetical protein